MQKVPWEHGQFDKAVEQYGSRYALSDAEAAYRVMTLCVMGMAVYIPDELREALHAAVGRWYLVEPSLDSLEPLRTACWEYLTEKNNGGTEIVDRVDVAVRSLICVLYEDPDAGDLDMTLDFFGNLLANTDLDALATSGLG